MTLKYSEVEGYDAEAVAAANRAYDTRTGFNWKDPGAGSTRLQYPPYVPVPPGYERPEGEEESEAMSETIFAWHERWFQAWAGVTLSL